MYSLRNDSDMTNLPKMRFVSVLETNYRPSLNCFLRQRILQGFNISWFYPNSNKELEHTLYSFTQFMATHLISIFLFTKLASKSFSVNRVNSVTVCLSHLGLLPTLTLAHYKLTTIPPPHLASAKAPTVRGILIATTETMATNTQTNCGHFLLSDLSELKKAGVGEVNGSSKQLLRLVSTLRNRKCDRKSDLNEQ